MMSRLQLIEKEAADWIAERDRGVDGRSLSATRQPVFDAWVRQSTDHLVAWVRLDAAWQRVDRLRALKAPALQQAHGLGRGSARRPYARLARWVGGMAAAMAMLAVVVDRLPDRSPDTYATDIGQRQSLALEDGTHLTLNTATRVHASITRKERQLWLDRGEAYFDVAHDASRPFVIHVGDRQVTVLGTKFSLLRDGERLQVIVRDGRVKVESEQVLPAVLTRNEAAVVEKSSVLVTHKTSQQTTASLSWMEGKLAFDQTTLADAARQFNRYNRRQLLIADPAAAGIAIGGIFEATNVDGFARLLGTGFGLTVRETPDALIISTPARG